MGCEAGRCKTSTPEGIFIVTPSLEGWPTNAKEAPSPHEVRLASLDTNPVFQSLGDSFFHCMELIKFFFHLQHKNITIITDGKIIKTWYHITKGAC